jgi:hypothetical protein
MAKMKEYLLDQYEEGAAEIHGLSLGSSNVRRVDAGKPIG